MKNYTLADFSSVFSEADFLHAGVIDGSLDMSIEYESDFQNTKALRGIIEEICIKF